VPFVWESSFSFGSTSSFKLRIFLMDASMESAHCRLLVWIAFARHGRGSLTDLLVAQSAPFGCHAWGLYHSLAPGACDKFGKVVCVRRVGELLGVWSLESGRGECSAGWIKWLNGSWSLPSYLRCWRVQGEGPRPVFVINMCCIVAATALDRWAFSRRRPQKSQLVVSLQVRTNWAVLLMNQSTIGTDAQSPEMPIVE
jgi:hypothetical protein